MSRIDEALRRAAAGQITPADSLDGTAAPERATGQDVAVLAREPFPVEIAERRRSRVSAPAEKAEPEPERPPSQADSDSGAPAAASGSVFERIDTSLAEKVVADGNMSAISREQYRRLAAVLHDAQTNSGLRVVMIASAVPGEGKTLTATNVALTLSESYRKRVLLVDADLRKPAIHQIFRITTASGLSDGLRSERDVKLVLRQVSPRLTVLPAGRPTSDPMAGLTSERMRRVVAEARETFDWVVIDTPPLMLLPDAHLLSALVDGAVMVIKANSTSHELVKRAADIIGRDRITGVVLNQAEASVQPGYGGYDYQGYYLTDTAEGAGRS